MLHCVFGKKKNKTTNNSKISDFPKRTSAYAATAPTPLVIDKTSAKARLGMPSQESLTGWSPCCKCITVYAYLNPPEGDWIDRTR